MRFDKDYANCDVEVPLHCSVSLTTAATIAAVASVAGTIATIASQPDAPEIPDRGAEEVEEARRHSLQLAANQQGSRSSILTPLNSENEPQTGRATILGTPGGPQPQAAA